MGQGIFSISVFLGNNRIIIINICSAFRIKDNKSQVKLKIPQALGYYRVYRCLYSRCCYVIFLFFNIRQFISECKPCYFVRQPTACYQLSHQRILNVLQVITLQMHYLLAPQADCTVGRMILINRTKRVKSIGFEKAGKRDMESNN